MDYITTDTELTSVANAIRTKGGTSEQLVYPNGFVSAIANISTGTELTSEDEGKVVIEDDGAYVLAEQTSQTITQNGTYDTTTINELIANISGGGGGSTNILSGTEMPTASDGDDGDIYLLVSGAFINIQPLVSSESELTVTVTANSYWSGFEPWRAFADSGNPWIGNGGNPHWLQIEIPNEILLYDVAFSVTDTNRGHAISRIGYSSDGSNYTDMVLESSTFTYGNGYARVASPIAARYFRLFFDGVYSGSYYPSIARLQMRRASDGDDTIAYVLLKVNGSWVPIEGQDIDDVDIGTGLTSEDEGKVVVEDAGSYVLTAQTSMNISENGTYDTTTNNEVIVSVQGGEGSDGSIYYGKLESDYSFAEANGIICTLSGRVYVKVTNSPAYVAYFFNGGFSGPILVSKVTDGVQYNDGGGVQTVKGSIIYNGELWYYSNTNRFAGGNQTSTGGFAKKLEGTLSVEDAAELLLSLALNEQLGLRFTSNGHYDVPNGYSGFGDFDVDVSPNLQDKSVVRNGLVIADNGYDGLNSVLVNVSGESTAWYTHDSWDALTFRQKVEDSPAFVGETIDMSPLGVIYDVIERHVALGNANTLTIPFSADGLEYHGFLYVWYNNNNAKADMQVTVGNTSYQQTDRNGGNYGWHEGYFLIPLESVSGDLTVTLSETVLSFGALLVVSETRFELKNNHIFANDGRSTYSVTAQLDCRAFVVYARGNDSGYSGMELTPSTSPLYKHLDQNYISSNSRYERDGVFLYDSTVAGENLSFVWSNTDGMASTSIICIGIK